MNIKGSTVVVTGANRGIGQALVAALLAQGAKKVYAGARDTSKIAKGDARVVPLKVDLGDEAGLAAAAKTAGDATLLINNAGVLEGGSQLTAPIDALRREFETNYFGTLRVIRAFVPVLEKNKPGAIVNLLSVVSWASMPALGAYSASKAASNSMTLAIRGELAKRGISVFGVYPGPVDTDMAKGIELTKTSPEDVANAILQGIESKTLYITPDPMAQQVYAGWKGDHAAVEAQFGNM
ncbi:MAG: SDR family oxidoreductase [Phycisphaerales bacterium]|jgi:NAD(P)-dependent dehydrogenase (short-subunit alcohol dehydrogenase family)